MGSSKKSRVTSASAWKGAQSVDGAEVDLPSGNVVLVKHLSPTAFLASGLIPDPLTAIIRKSIHTKKGLNPKDLEKMVADGDNLVETMKMFDEVVCNVTIEPKIIMPPACAECGKFFNIPAHTDEGAPDHHEYDEAPRESGDFLYVDQVDLQDKIRIFQWSFGETVDLETFRQGQQGALESLPDGQDLLGEAFRTAGR